MVEMNVGFQFGSKRFDSAFDGLDAFAKRLGSSVDAGAPAFKKELRFFMEGVVAALEKRHSTPYPSGTSPAGVIPGTLSRRSSGIAAGLLEGIEIKGDLLPKIDAALRGSRVQAAHEFGAVIRPKRAAFLTVPLPAALNADGTPIKARARDWDRTFVQRSKKGNLLIFRREVGRRIVPLYLLVGPGEPKQFVEIPPRLGVGLTFRTVSSAFVERAVDAMLREIRRDALS